LFVRVLKMRLEAGNDAKDNRTLVLFNPDLP